MATKTSRVAARTTRHRSLPALRHLDPYLSHLADARGVSPHTLRSYRADLSRFSRGLDEDLREAPEQIALPDLKAYVARLIEEGLDRRSVARHASALRGYFRFLHETGVRPDDPSSLLEVPRQRRSLPRALSREDVERLLLSPASAKFADLRDRAMLEVLYSAGVRVSELVGMNVSDLDLSRGLVAVRGKGDRERLALLGSYAREAITAWLPERSSRLAGATSDALFLNARGGRLSDRSVRRMFESRLIQAGLPASVTPHTLRHTFATHMLESGAGLKEVQEMLGHRHLSSTQVYTHVSPEHLRRAYEEAHPRVSPSTMEAQEGAS